MSEFYCGNCGNFKPEDQRCSRPAGKTPICAECNRRAAKMQDPKVRHNLRVMSERSRKQYLAGKVWVPK